MDIIASAFLPLFGLVVLLFGIPLIGFLFGIGFSLAQKLVHKTIKMGDLKNKVLNTVAPSEAEAAKPAE